MGTVKKLIVEIVDARGLLPKDGHGTSSPYVLVDFYGQRKRTRSVICDLNPVWNEVLEFNVGDPSDVFGNMLEIDLYHDRAFGPTRRNNFLGRIRLNSSQFVPKGEEALVYFPLEKKNFFSWIQGEIGLKIYYLNEPINPPPSSEPLSTTMKEEEKSETTPPAAAEEVAPQPQAEEANPPEAPLPPPAEPQPQAEPETEVSAKPDESAAAEQEAPVAAAPSPENVDPPPPPPDSQSKNATETQAADTPPPPPSEPPVEAAAAAPEVMPEAKVIGGRLNSGSASRPISRQSTTESFFPISSRSASRPISRQSTTDSFFSISSASSFSSSYCDASASPLNSISQRSLSSSYDLVEKMHYLFVKIIKARSLAKNSIRSGSSFTTPVIKISVSNCHVTSKPAHKTNTFFYEWNQTFAFRRETPESFSTMEISIWDIMHAGGAGREMFIGGVCFDVTEIPIRDPPDSPLAPQWYRLEGDRQAHNGSGDLMLATWIGTQADESFFNAWKNDTSAAAPNSQRSKVYLSPKLWYLRATVIEAQDIILLTSHHDSSSFQVKAQSGFQVAKTKAFVNRPNHNNGGGGGGGGTPSWNEDLLFVAAEPLTDHYVSFSLQNHRSSSSSYSSSKKGTTTSVVLGVARIPLATIERRVDDRKVASRWFNLTDEDSNKYRGRIHLRLCFDGGYHVMDESAHACSDFRPTARQLWKPPIGSVELGILGCKNLLPNYGKPTTDAYSVAKYGNKWVRTRTISNTLDPKWNEQYTWDVYDPCTVLTIGVFDDHQSGCNSEMLMKGGGSSAAEVEEQEEQARGRHRPPDLRMGKVRIRLSTLQTGKVYKNTYPLLLLSPSRGLKKMGEIELAVRFVSVVSTLDFSLVYTQPMLPVMHHIKPIGVVQLDLLRDAASKMVAHHLSQSEPPLSRDVVWYMLDADSHAFSMRKVRANWFRIINVVGGLVDMVRWVDSTRSWKNATATLLVHALFVMLVWYPDLIIPTLAFYLFVIGMWNYRFRSRTGGPSQMHLDAKMSHADVIDLDELDEEFDTMPSSRSPDRVRCRYDKLRALGARVQTILGDLATQGERMQALVTWRDPRATGMFIGLCLVTALVLYLVPTKMVATTLGFYYMRHPMFRDRKPSPALNFFRRLPSLTDRIM